jgi:hypothetical protein
MGTRRYTKAEMDHARANPTWYEQMCMQMKAKRRRVETVGNFCPVEFFSFDNDTLFRLLQGAYEHNNQWDVEFIREELLRREARGTL